MAKTTNLYQDLGIASSAAETDIKAAFRKGAKENHPDRSGHLPPQEQARKEAKFKEMNDAYEVLSDANKRSRYDKELKDIEIARVDAENSVKVQKEQKKEEVITIPENDWGLFAALKMAYSSKSDGKWRIEKSEFDRRRWMPENVYTVVKKGENVQIFRTLIDWRDKADRDREIRIRKSGIDGAKFEENKIKPDDLIGEHFLFGEGKKNFEESYRIPSEYGTYIKSLKTIAKQFADRSNGVEGNYDASQELRNINKFGKYYSQNTRVEGNLYNLKDEDREWVREITVSEFSNKFNKAEGRVTQVEVGNTAPEGRVKSTFHGGGEARG